MNAGGTLVNGMDSGFPVVLLHRKISGVTCPSKHLNGHGGTLQPHFGWIAFGDWDQ